jgi:hypothetical protein
MIFYVPSRSDLKTIKEIPQERRDLKKGETLRKERSQRDNINGRPPSEREDYDPLSPPNRTPGG